MALGDTTTGTQAADQMQQSAAAATPTAPDAGAAPKQEMQPEATPSTGEIATQPLQQMTQLTPTKRGGILGVVDSVMDALTGTTRPEMATDQDGNKYVKQQTMSRGAQWAKLGGEALVGAAAGLAAGRGKGMGAAGAAGVQAGTKIAGQEHDEENELEASARQDKLDKMNAHTVSLKNAASELELTRKGLEITKDQIDLAKERKADLIAGHAQDLGIFDSTNFQDLQKADPDIWKHHFNKNLVDSVPEWSTDENGKAVRTGTHFYLKIRDDSNDPLPPGTTIRKYVPGETATQPGHMETFTPSAGMTKGQKNTYDDTANNEMKADQKKIDDLLHTEAGTAADNANASKVPSEIAANKALAFQRGAEGNKANADAAKTRFDSGQSAAGSALIDEIGTGKIAFERLAYLAARNPDLLASVASKYHDFDSSKVASYISTYKDYTNSKPGSAGGALNAGATALKHLNELRQLNTVKSHIYGTADYNRYQNKVDTLSTELARFYGDSTIPAIATIKKTLASTLPGNRQAAIETQAQSMGDKFDSYEQTWKNAAPSKNYEAPMPGIDEKAKEARAALDPAYRQRLVQEKQGIGAQPQQAQQSRPPAGATGQAQGPDGKMHWADATGKDYGLVQP